MRRLNYQIEEQENGIELKTYLRQKGYSVRLLRKLKNRIFLEGKPTFLRERLKEGQTLFIEWEEENGSEKILPVNLNLNILYEDEDILIVNKQSGMPVHPSQGNYGNTLANGIAFYCQQKGENYPFRAINRLDKDTTGLVLLAKNGLSAAILSEMVKNNKIHREYLAICSGEVPLEGMIDAPIARREGSILERCVDKEKGDTAITCYKRIWKKNHCSLVRLWLKTGRTHQIRVHMKYIGHPLLGDFLYHADFSRIQRQSLHSYRMEFDHPIERHRMKFICPIPNDMKQVILEDF